MSIRDSDLHTETVEYGHGELLLEGYLAYDRTASGKRPGILIIHDWSGLGSEVRRRAAMLAAEGYVAFGLDLYGKGVRPQTTEERRKLTGALRADRPLMRARAAAGLDVLRNAGVCDGRLASIGYCIGGLTALELARSGADLQGVVSFHGSLDTPNPADGRNIRGRVLVCHGAEDPHVPQAQVAAFMDEMRSARVDWQLVFYGGAMHAFAVPGTDAPEMGLRYDPAADRRSWKTMLDFFAEIFGGTRAN
jgi:dienelactone hydrolase